MLPPIPKPEPREKKPRNSFYKGTKPCKTCGVNFRSQNLAPKYCSRACMWADKTTVQKKVCTCCGKTFEFQPSQLKAYPNAGRYCSRECGYAFRVQETAKKPTRDKYGRTNRTADKSWQVAIREQDNSTCQRCGVYEEHIHTHHIAPRSQRPDLRHDVSNGVCLCGSCHQWVHHNPIEAEKLGLLSGAKYELNRLKQRYIAAGEAQKNGQIFTCPDCGETKYYPASRTVPKTHYGCTKKRLL